MSYGNNRKTTLTYETGLGRLTNLQVARPEGMDKLMNNSYSYMENGLLSQITDGVDGRTR